MLLTFYYSVAVYTVLIFLFIPNKSAKYNACKFILNENRVTHSNSFYKITIQTNPEELYKSVEPKPIMKTQVKKILTAMKLQRRIKNE